MPFGLLMDLWECHKQFMGILENAGHLGLPIPEKLKAVLEQLHDRAENEKEDE